MDQPISNHHIVFDIHVPLEVGELLDEGTIQACSTLLDYLNKNSQQFDALDGERLNLFGGIEQCIEDHQAELLADFLGQLGKYFYYNGHWTLAVSYLPEGVEANQEIGNPWREVLLRHNLGVICQGQGNYGRARRV